MQNTGFLLSKLMTAPSVFGIESITLWLEDVNDIDTFEKIKPLLDRNLSKNQWRGILVFINQKYANTAEPTHDFNNIFEKFSGEIIHGKLDSVYLLDDKSKVVDFSKLSDLKKARVSMLKGCEELTFLNSELEMLSIVFLPKLNKFTNMESVTNLRYLTIVKCNNLKEIGFIRELKNLVYLDISNNKLIENIDFISEDSEIRIFYLLESNVIKNKTTIPQLIAMKNLKYLYIKANKIEERKLQECLPNCFINGKSPLIEELK